LISRNFEAILVLPSEELAVVGLLSCNASLVEPGSLSSCCLERPRDTTPFGAVAGALLARCAPLKWQPPVVWFASRGELGRAAATPGEGLLLASSAPMRAVSMRGEGFRMAACFPCFNLPAGGSFWPPPSAGTRLNSKAWRLRDKARAPCCGLARYLASSTPLLQTLMCFRINFILANAALTSRRARQ